MTKIIEANTETRTLTIDGVETNAALKITNALNGLPHVYLDGVEQMDCRVYIDGYIRATIPAGRPPEEPSSS